LIVPGNS